MAKDSRTDEAWAKIEEIIGGKYRPEWNRLEALEAIHGWSYLGLQDWQKKPAEKKLWGRTCRLYADARVQVERIEVLKGGHCSWHKHARKHNAFLIDEGRLKIETPDTEVILAPHYHDDAAAMQGEFQCYFVPAGVWHRFVALEYTVALEVYTPVTGAWVDPDGDIERRDQGGVLANVPA